MLLLLGATGCSALGDGACTVGDRRCNGATVEQCTAHPAGYDVDPSSGISHHHKSPNSWEPTATCRSADVCQTGSYTDKWGAEKVDAFCATSSDPDPACAGGSNAACAGTAPSMRLVTCHDGFAIDLQTCRSCDLSQTEVCAGGLFDGCTQDSDCAGGLTCVRHACVMACACPDGAACSACDALPDAQGQSTWLCQSGACTRPW